MNFDFLGGLPKCGANQTYVGCKIGCPTNYCPSDDSRAQVACSIPYPCKGGCACQAGHLIVSRENPQCVLAQDCRKLTFSLLLITIIISFWAFIHSFTHH